MDPANQAAEVAISTPPLAIAEPRMAHAPAISSVIPVARSNNCKIMGTPDSQ
jgi:hypothetical protein